jgi:hypothetical protein
VNWREFCSLFSSGKWTLATRATSMSMNKSSQPYGLFSESVLKERTKTVSNMQRGPRKHYSLSGKSHDQFRDPAHRAVELDLTSSSWFHVPAAKNRVSVVSQVVNRMKKHSHAHTHAQKEKKRVSRCLSSHLSHITRSDRHLYPMRKERKKAGRQLGYVPCSAS